jgi:demethylmenaquinone methyltransferase/2-methoxy-6-polyprenyl-1,4-benzoquinol methylase
MLVQAGTDGPLVEADVLRLPLPDARVDGATCGFALRNVADLEAFFRESARVVRPGGRVSFLEASEPEGGLLRVGHGLYFNRIVPLIGGALSDRDAYRYLPRSMAYLPPPARLVQMLEGSGFGGVERIPLAAGAAQLLLGTRR